MPDALLIARLVFLPALLLFAAPVLGDPEIKGKPEALTYQDNYKNAVTIVREWKQDALLYRADVLDARRDGTVDAGAEGDGSIAYFFYSPALHLADPSMGGSFRVLTIAKGQLTIAPPPDEHAEAHQQAAKRHLPGDPVGVHAPMEQAEKQGCDFGLRLNGWLFADVEGGAHPFRWCVSAAPAGTPTVTADAMTGVVLEVSK